MADKNNVKGEAPPTSGIDPEDKRSLLKAGAFVVTAIALMVLLKLLAGW